MADAIEGTRIQSSTRNLPRDELPSTISASCPAFHVLVVCQGLFSFSTPETMTWSIEIHCVSVRCMPWILTTHASEWTPRSYL